MIDDGFLAEAPAQLLRSVGAWGSLMVVHRTMTVG